MAAAVVNKKQTGSAVASTLTITSATAGNLLVAFISQTASVSAPTGKDQKSGSTGWTVNATKALNAASANSLWVAMKIAVGGETELNPTVGAGGAIQGISYFELSGASETVDVINNKDNAVSVKTITSNAITTTDAGDIVLAAVSDGAAATGTISAWTGTGPMTNVETASTRCMAGSYIPGTTLAAVTFTANWETSKGAGILVVAIKPAATGVAIPLNPASSSSSASMAVTAATQVPLSPAASSSAASAAVSAATQIPLQAAASASAATAAVTAATQVPLSPAVSASSASAAVTAATQIPLSPASSTSSASMAVSAATQIPLQPASSTSSAQATVTVGSTPTVVPLNPAVSTSAASMSLTAATQVPLSPAASTSSATMGLTAATQVPLNPASSTSSAVCTVTIGTPSRIITLPGLVNPRQKAGTVTPAEAAGLVAPRHGHRIAIGLRPRKGLYPRIGLYPRRDTIEPD